MRGYFSQDEAENAGILTDSEDDNEVLRKIDRKGCLLFVRYQYKTCPRTKALGQVGSTDISSPISEIMPISAKAWIPGIVLTS